jgi:hypothetical protein
MPWALERFQQSGQSYFVTFFLLSTAAIVVFVRSQKDVRSGV